MPPMEPPATQYSRGRSRWRTTSRCACTMSPMVITGKLSPYGLPVAVSIDAGPVLPWQPPMKLVHTTK